MVCRLRKSEHDPPCGRTMVLAAHTERKQLPIYVCPFCDGPIPRARSRKAA